MNNDLHQHRVMNNHPVVRYKDEEEEDKKKPAPSSPDSVGPGSAGSPRSMEDILKQHKVEKDAADQRWRRVEKELEQEQQQQPPQDNASEGMTTQEPKTGLVQPPPPSCPSWWPAEPHALDTIQEREEAESHEEHMERIDAMLSGVEEADSRGYVGGEGSDCISRLGYVATVPSSVLNALHLNH